MVRSAPPASEPPAIVVAYRPHLDCAETLREICAGIEEEGIRSRTIALELSDAAALAYEAANQSPLLVGVGVDQAELCVHVSALPLHTPLERRRASSRERACQRHIGHNAARLAKAMPLKGYCGGTETDALEPGEDWEGASGRHQRRAVTTTTWRSAKHE